MKRNSLPLPTKDLKTKIIGVWTLKSRKDVDPEGQIVVDPFLGQDPIGILCFGPNQFSAQFMRSAGSGTLRREVVNPVNQFREADDAVLVKTERDRSETNENVPSERAQDKNNTAALNGYDAYFGTYTVDQSAGTIATTLDGSISPLNIGKTFVRDARVVGNELIIHLKTTSVDGRAITRTNTFEKVDR